jgi:dTDP-4-dehydrorhamnose 3,5-epimerase
VTQAGASPIQEQTGIPGCLVLSGGVHADARGRFAKPYAAPAFEAAGLKHDWAECFWSVSRKGVVRGFHVQLPPAEHAKLVWVVSGASHSALIDIRAGSPAYHRAATVRLDAAGGKALYVPAGIAHGFQALEDDTTLIYLVTSAHDAAHDSGVRWDSAGVTWPLPVTEVSARDRALEPLASFKTPFRFEP